MGWGPALAQVLKLDFDVAIPSTGPAISRADLEALKTKIDTLVSRATRLVKHGVPKDQLMAQLKTDDLGWQLSFTGDQLDSFYAELSQTKQAVEHPQGAPPLCTGPLQPSTEVGSSRNAKERTMEWTSPQFEEICLNCEINCYANAEL